MSNYSEEFRVSFTRKWISGMPTAQMAIELGMVSKNAVIGLRSRMGLEPRPTPIRRPDGGGAIKPPQAARRPKLAPTPQPAPAPQIIAPIDRDSWLRWFAGLPLDHRRKLAQATHAESCPLAVGGGMWDCRCGATLPARLQASDRPGDIDQLEEEPEGEDDGADEADEADEHGEQDPHDAELEEAAEQDDDAELEEEAEQDDDAVGEPDAAPEHEEEGEEEEVVGLVQRRVPVFATGCYYPKGQVGSRDFRYCDKPISGSGSYCEECRKLVYAPKEVRRRLDHRLSL